MEFFCHTEDYAKGYTYSEKAIEKDFNFMTKEIKDKILPIAKQHAKRLNLLANMLCARMKGEITYLICYDPLKWTVKISLEHFFFDGAEKLILLRMVDEADEIEFSDFSSARCLFEKKEKLRNGLMFSVRLDSDEPRINLIDFPKK